MFGKLLLYFALLLWFVVPSQAQPTIILPNLTGTQGSQIEVDVKVQNYTDIVSTQFSLKWDEAVLRYDSVSNFGLPMLNQNQHFGTTNATEGVIVFAWLDDTLIGVTVEDGTTIFTLNFTVLGELNEQTDIWLDSMPAAIEIVDINGIVNDYNLQNGSLTVDNSVSAAEAQLPPLTVHQNFPNPFRKSTSIDFDLRTAEEVALIVYDIKGVKVMERSTYYGPGHHTIFIAKEQLPHEGTYIYELRTADHVAINKLVLVK